jgi:predicted nucleotidyltransferase
MVYYYQKLTKGGVQMKELSINKAVINELVSGILSIIPSGLSAIILYGSVAKGTDQHDSDVDVALIIERPMSTEQNDKLSDFIVDMDLKYDKVFSVIDLINSDIENYNSIIPFYRNVKEEGIVLWKAA